jgi:hypothetical protein
MQIFDVLRMQISPFEGRRQEEYLNPEFTSFQIMKCAPISSVSRKIGSKNMDFLKFHNWSTNVMLNNNANFYKITFINFFISINYGLSRLLVILQNPNKLIY